MDSERTSLPSRFEPDTIGARVTIDYRPRNVTMRYVSDQELETLGTASNDLSLHLGFFGISVGIAATCAVTLSTVDITSPRVFAAYCAVAAITGIAATFFFIKSILEYRKSRHQLAQIREESPVKEVQGRA